MYREVMACQNEPPSYIDVPNDQKTVTTIDHPRLRVLYGSPDWLSQVQSEEESIKQIKTVYNDGITTFDMSNAYSNEESVVVLGKAIKQENLPRDGITVMTKVFHPEYDTSTLTHETMQALHDAVQAGHRSLVYPMQTHLFMTIPPDPQLALPSDNMVPGGRKEWHNTIITRLEEIALQKNITMTQVAITSSMSKEHQY
ncbi:Aldo keto reductase [Armillaria luteobubalina]|uniref:Aldo keto reductase n=1 Tax=Armillaria luteobubalina TaxID=153913 RepID=A0AA39ULY8_9AGAR|nr:Aldo keto reductase [Armillaria luteobubalina]